MRALMVTVVLALLAMAGCESSESNVAQSRDVQVASSSRTLRHMVLFKFKDDAPSEQVQGVVTAFRALPSQINVIRDFEWGTDVSPEGRAQGFTHAFFLTFATAADRDAYLVHPAHKEFGRTLGPVLDKVLVVDYWAQK